LQTGTYVGADLTATVDVYFYMIVCYWD